MRLHLAVRRPVTIWIGILIIVILGVVSVSVAHRVAAQQKFPS